MNKFIQILFFVALFSHVSIAQQKRTLDLPFQISSKKKLNVQDTLSKVPDFDHDYVPELGYDNLAGFSYGFTGSLFYNGKKNDSIFYYSDYKFRIDFALGGSYKNGHSIFEGDNQIYFKVDAPYVFRSRYRISGQVNIESNPYNLYYGIISDSPSKDQNATNSDPLYHYFKQYEKSVSLSIERMCAKGFLWPYISMGYTEESISALSNSQLGIDAYRGAIVGVGNVTLPNVRFGIRLDTRNNSVNPTSGIVMEISREYAIKLDKNSFRFNKTFFYFNYYSKLKDTLRTYKYHSKKLPVFFNTEKECGTKQNKLNYNFHNENVFAFRYAIGTVNGSAPFSAYQNYSYSEDNISVVGGDDNLRGFPQTRFVGKVISFLNFEMRSSIYSFQNVQSYEDSNPVIKNNENTNPSTANLKCRKKITYYQLGVVPFIDIGGAWNSFTDYVRQFNNYRISEGIGARLVVNSDFVIRLDYGISKEGKFTIFKLAQTF